VQAGMKQFSGRSNLQRSARFHFHSPNVFEAFMEEDLLAANSY